MRRKPAMRYSGIAAVAAAGLAIAGCGQQQMGAAAFYTLHQQHPAAVSDVRISSRELAAQVANLNAGYQADKAKLHIRYTPADMPRQVLGWELRFAADDQLAASEGIHVTSAAAQAQLNAQAIRARQSGDTLDEVAVLNGIPPDLKPQLGRWLAIEAALTRKLDHGVPPTTSAQANALGLALGQLRCLAAKSMRITVNPQYGAFDYGQFIVVAAPDTLSASQSGGAASPSPSPSHAPQLTPRC